MSRVVANNEWSDANAARSDPSASPRLCTDVRVTNSTSSSHAASTSARDGSHVADVPSMFTVNAEGRPNLISCPQCGTRSGG